MRRDEEYRSEWEPKFQIKISCPGCNGDMVTADGSLWKCRTCGDMLEY